MFGVILATVPIQYKVCLIQVIGDETEFNILITLPGNMVILCWGDFK